MNKWHKLSITEAARLVAVDVEQGLFANEAKKRLARYGQNKLRKGRRFTALVKRFIDMKKHPRYIPAFHFRWLTPWYDPMMRRLFPEGALKTALIVQARIQSGQNVLDMGCGMGTLTLLIKQTHPNAGVYGLDVDPQVLDIAQRKAEQAGETIVLQQGSATCLPYPDGNFDRVFASLMLHHLAREHKRRALVEAFRVLKPGGELHVADFGKPHDPSMWLISLVVRWVEEVHDNILGLLPIFMAETGFRPVEETARYRTVAGTLALYRACKPMGDVI